MHWPGKKKTQQGTVEQPGEKIKFSRKMREKHKQTLKKKKTVKQPLEFMFYR